MRMALRIAPVALLALGLSGVCGTVADAAETFKGKTIRITVGSSPGGGFDAFGRMVGRHLGGHLPGKPNVVVSNLPGAGSMKAVQSLKTGAKDGTYIVLFNPGTVVGSLLRPKKIKMKFTDVSYLGSATADARVCYAWGTTGVKTFQDLLKRSKFSTGHTGNSASTYIDAAILKNMFGAKLNQILGYKGATEQRLAVERGELDGDCGSWGSVPSHWVRDKKINIFVRISKATLPDIPKVPHVSAFANAEQKKMLNMLLTQHEFFRPFIVSKEVPAARLKVLRDAFWATVTSKAFLADAAKAKRAVIKPLTGEQLAQAVASIYETPAALVKMSAGMIK